MDMGKFGDWLIKQMNDQNLKQSDLARSIGITTAQMSRIISGERNAGKNTLVKIAEVLRLPPDLVFEQAGVLPSKVELSPIKRALIHLAETLPDSDIEIAISVLEQREDYYRKNPSARPIK